MIRKWKWSLLTNFGKRPYTFDKAEHKESVSASHARAPKEPSDPTFGTSKDYPKGPST